MRQRGRGRSCDHPFFLVFSVQGCKVIFADLLFTKLTILFIHLSSHIMISFLLYILLVPFSSAIYIPCRSRNCASWTSTPSVYSLNILMIIGI